MAAEPINNLQDQLLMVAQSIVKVAEAVPSPVDRQPDDVAIPYNFFCPLSNSIMIDPVLLSNGQTCEKSELKDWLKSKSTICPMTGEALLNRDVTPNHLIRVLIREWCKKQNKSHLIQYTDSTPLYITQEYFESLHLKLSFAAEQKEAAKDVRKETIDCAYFRMLYDRVPEATLRLIAPLSQSDGNSKIDPQLEEDLIATLSIMCVDDTVVTELLESTDGISVLIKALQSDNMETQRNAALAIFEMSYINSTKELFGETDAMLNLATLLIRSRCKFHLEDVKRTLLRLFENKENKVKAVEQFANAGIFQKIEDSGCVDIMLPIFASLSKLQEGINEIEKYDCNPLLRILRESQYSYQEKVYVLDILLSAVKNNGSKWKKMIIEAENASGIISGISRIVYSDAKKTAMLNLLKD